MGFCAKCSGITMCRDCKAVADKAYRRAAELGAFCRQIDGTPQRGNAEQKIGRAKREPAGSFLDAVAAAERRAVDARKMADRLSDHAIGLRERGTGKSSGGEVKRRPHVHRAVYFGTPAEHNRKLLEGAIRCLTQWEERNPGHAGRQTGRNARYLVELLSRMPDGFDEG